MRAENYNFCVICHPFGVRREGDIYVSIIMTALRA
jgi:hypothetical protein